MLLGKYSFGLGDRFGRQGKAQLAAVLEAKAAGLDVTPVWNKSFREHSIVGTSPADVRAEADAAVACCAWEGAYLVDADHIGLQNVDHFLEASDFFTLDVADAIGRRVREEHIEAFVKRYAGLSGDLRIDGLAEPIVVDEPAIRRIAEQYLFAVQEAGRIYRHIEAAKGKGSFLTEVSMDETDTPQRPVELLFILAAIADEGIPAQTIAPRFSGRFNKGVDYVGDPAIFAREFERDVAVIRFAVERFRLPAGLKLSVHSGSDKFAIYGSVRETLKKFDAGVHIKTAGTTWLEELAGLALAGGDGLAIAKDVYVRAFERADELCSPYAAVIDINRAELPSPMTVAKWDGQSFAAALRHDPECARYNPHLRQLLHVGYKVAAELGERFLEAVVRCEHVIAPNVTENLYRRHIAAVFGS